MSSGIHLSISHRATVPRCLWSGLFFPRLRRWLQEGGFPMAAKMAPRLSPFESMKGSLLRFARTVRRLVFWEPVVAGSVASKPSRFGSGA